MTASNSFGNFPMTLGKLSMEVVLSLRLKQMLHCGLVVGSTEDDIQGFADRVSDSQVSRKNRAGLWGNLQSWTWQAPANAMEPGPVKHLQECSLPFI